VFIKVGNSVISRDQKGKLIGLNERIRTCRSCKLWKTRTQAVTGEGTPHSTLLMVAQAPGYSEDEEGRMFIGPSGKKLDELLEYARISRGEIYMTNLVKCVLPDYRKPKPSEIETCSQYLDQEIQILNPAAIATLGYYPAKYVFEKYKLEDGFHFSEICGHTFCTEGKTILPLRHPATLLYNPETKEEMRKNYRKLKTLMNNIDDGK